MLRRTFALSAALMPGGLEAAPPPSNQLEFEVWDVFTHRAYGGNALGVVWLNAPLSPPQMLAIAREFQHSETTFVLPANKVRIFTTEEELPFAGHPVLGTAFAIHRRKPSASVTLDIPRGPIAVDFLTASDGTVSGEMHQGDPQFGSTHDPAAIAPLIGVSAGDIDTSIPVESVSTGLWKILVPLKSLKAIQSVRLEHAAIAAYCARSRNERGVYLVTREAIDKTALVHARNIAARTEDAATGSAVGTCIAWLVKHGWAESGKRHWVEQGTEIFRPSRLEVRATLEAGKVRDVRVGGQSVLTASGTMRMPY